MYRVAEQRNHGTSGADAAGTGSDRAPEEVQQQTEPPARPEAPRSVYAMLFSMLPLVLVGFVVAGLLGECSFSPLGPSIDQSKAPTVDATRQLHDKARQVDFPVVEPQLPWRANSAAMRRLDSGAHSVQVGWVTGTHYLRLSQSNASEEELVTSETEQPPRAEGVARAAGRQWVVYGSVRSEKAWVSDRDGVRLLITGSGNEAEFRTLAQATLSAGPA